MENRELYETIFKRKSIRNYDLTPLDQKTLDEISEYIQSLTPLYDDLEVELKIIPGSEVKTRIMKKAPHYMAVFSQNREVSQNKEGYLTNVGFMLQQMDLFLSARGLGSCWQGIPKPTKEVLKSSDLEFVILMAFGEAKEPVHRKSVSEFKRKSLQDISDVSGVDELMEAARLAPSAGNSQPWFFSGNENVINVYSTKSGFIRSLLVKKYLPIDVGIAIYHLKLAAEYSGKNAEIVFDNTLAMNSPSGYEYVASLRLKSDKND